jgi:hypothetical protein
MKWTILFLGTILLFSCDLLNRQVKNPLFSGTTFIDRCSPTSTGSTNFPDFKWESPGSQASYEVVGVFTAHITVSGDKQIVNTSDCVAMWTSGMTGSAGNVNFNYFKKVSGGVLQSAFVDTNTLASNTSYYWAVWAYNSDSEVSHSSGENPYDWHP